jgi:hypothetical protein
MLGLGDLGGDSVSRESHGGDQKVTPGSGAPIFHPTRDGLRSAGALCPNGSCHDIVR